MRRLAPLLLALVALAGCTAPAAPAKLYPDRMAALGDSISAGYNVARDKLGANPGDAWSTGDAPDDGVTSHYERLLALNPAIAGHAQDFAEGGARMRDFAAQAQQAVDAKAEYVTVMFGANDVCARGNMTSPEAFRAQFRAGADELAQLPKPSWVLVVSVPNVTTLWDRYHAIKPVHDIWQELRACPRVLSDAADNASREAARERIDAYDEILREESAAYGFLYDDGTVHDAPIDPVDVGPVDAFHPSLRGQDALANATWALTPFAHR